MDVEQTARRKLPRLQFPRKIGKAVRLVSVMSRVSNLEMQIDRQLVLSAMSQPGFDNWQPRLDDRHLDRPRSRPASLEGIGRQGAVLLIVYRERLGEGRTRVVLTRRHAKLNNHAGQISLPGGQQDQGESLEQTALREAREEIGIEPAEIEILGRLNQVYIPPSDFTVVPFVGWCWDAPEFVRSQSEVDEIIEASVEDLLNPATLTRGPMQIGEIQRQVAYYQVDKHRVWGATAIILNEFLLRIRAVLGTNNLS